MHPFGLTTLIQFLWEHGIPSLSIMVLGLLLSAVFLRRLDESCQNSPATLPHLSLFYITSSLKRRHDFFAWGFKVTKQRLFQFRLLRVCQTSGTLMALTFIDDGAPPMNIDQSCRRLWGTRAERFLWRKWAG